MSAVFALLCWAGCTPGSGTGAVTGDIFLAECSGNHDSLSCLTGSAADCVAPDGSSDPAAQLQCLVAQTRCSQFHLDLRPQFFAGEPIEDPSATGTQRNRLLIRIQRLGKRPEFDDVLMFDVHDQFEVARCLRQRTRSDGSPDWDPRACAQVGDDVYVRVGPGEFVRASLTLVNSCGSIPLVGTPSIDSRYKAAPEPVWAGPGPNDSWVVFSTFGSAMQRSKLPSERDPVPDDFKLLFGDTIDGKSFRLQIEDDRVLEAQLLGPLFQGPIPESRINGVVEGQFHFDLQRSSSAQAYP